MKNKMNSQVVKFYNNLNPNTQNTNDEFVQETPQTVGDYKYYRIFSGALDINCNDVESVKLERLQFLSCAKAQQVARCSLIKDNLTLNTKLSRKMFDNYVEKCLNEGERNNYSIIPGWLNYIGNNQIVGLKSLMKNNEKIVSAQYSKTCKLFILPKEFLRPQWIDKMDFYTTNKDMDLVFFIILKKSCTVDEGVKITPEPMSFEVSRAYKLVNYEGKVKGKPLNVDILKEVSRANVNNNGNRYKRGGVQSCRPEVNRNYLNNEQLNMSNLNQYANNVSEKINLNGIMRNNNNYNNFGINQQHQNINNNRSLGIQRSRGNSMAMNNTFYDSRENS